MRAAFVQALIEAAEADDRIVLLTGDLGYNALEPFAERFPDRFLNVGVAEQNMIGVATGLAEGGLVPFAYSIGTFASLRPYEFIRNGPLLHRLPVRVVGMGGGFDYGHNGISHYALEDVALMRAQPNIAVLAPADSAQTHAVVRSIRDLDMPVYLRLGRSGESILGLDGRFDLGRAEEIGAGRDVAILASGSIASEAVRAAELLAGRRVEATVLVLASISPAPFADLARLFAEVPLVVTLEAHYINGGIGSLAAEVIAEGRSSCQLVRLGVTEMPVGTTGTEAYCRDRFGVSAEDVVTAVTERQ